MLGGIGSAVGAVIGGLLLGLLEAFAPAICRRNTRTRSRFIVILVVLFAHAARAARPRQRRAGMSVRRIDERPAVKDGARFGDRFATAWSSLARASRATG